MEFFTGLLNGPIGENDSVLDQGELPDGSFRAVASAFGSMVDSFIPTVIHRGAFTKTIQERGAAGNRGVKILLHHDVTQPVGLPTRMVESDIGLEIEGKIDPTRAGRDALISMRSGTLDAVSIGFDAVKFDFEETAEGTMIRHIREVRLWEVSLVTFGADPEARITEVNSMFKTRGESYKNVMEQFSINHGKLTSDGINPVRDLDVVDSTRNGNAQERVAAWAGGTESLRYGQAFVVSDSEGHQFQIADVVNGRLQVTKDQLLKSAIQFHLQGECKNQGRIRSHFAHYFNKFEIEAPWSTKADLGEYPREVQAQLHVAKLQEGFTQGKSLSDMQDIVKAFVELSGAVIPDTPDTAESTPYVELQNQYLDMELQMQSMLMDD